MAVFSSPPLQLLTTKTIRILLVVSLLLTAYNWYLLKEIGASLYNPHAPWGIVSFEFAGTLDQARLIMDSWKDDARIDSVFSLKVDFVFLFLYSTALALSCVLCLKTYQPSTFLYNLGIGMAWGQWFAAIFDAIENYALLQILSGTSLEFYPIIAFISASVKFLLVGLGFLYITYSGLFMIYFKIKINFNRNEKN